jgi:hypothetical protein
MVTVDLKRRPGMRWAVAAAVAAVAAGVVVGGVLLSAQDDLDDLMNRRVVAALERADPAAATTHPSAHAGHGPVDPNRRTDIDGHELRCAARAFGHEPADATSIDDVTVIYAHRMCAAVGARPAGAGAIRETGPVAVRLGVPDTLVLPENALPDEPDANYAERIRAVIPRRHHGDALAFTDFVDPGVAEQLQGRIED